MRSPAFAHMVKSQSFFRWHLTTGANAGTRIKPDFFSHLTILKFQVEGWSSAAVRGRTGQAGLLRSARAGGCTPGMPVRGRTGQADLLPSARPERAQQSPRRGRVLSSRSSAALSRRSVARIDSGGTPPVRGRTGQAAFLRSAKAGRSQKIYRRGREPANRSSAAQAAAPWREETAEALRRGMVKKKT